MDSPAIIDVLSRTLPGDPSRFEAVSARDGMPTIYVAADALVETCRVLRDAPELRFVFLADITAVDYLPPSALQVLTSGVSGHQRLRHHGERLRLQVRVMTGARVPTVMGIWPAANWAERGSRRIRHRRRPAGSPAHSMPDDWEGHPARRTSVQIRCGENHEPLRLWKEFVASVGGESVTQG
jgi:NADH-quinone oxidoreductase subunit C